MGERGNIGVKVRPSSGLNDNTGIIWFYTHWNGDVLPVLVEEALSRSSDRWDDPGYAARIIATFLIGTVEGDTGWGMNLVPDDNDYPLIVIDLTTKQVVLDPDYDPLFGLDLSTGKRVPFSEFSAREGWR